ncbi:Cytochrome [Abeliophyllum distichum]|uniref:Cytochrome n=1 Tax=Abeliophyllum distichum TaxID=126358 RepID=A0ABD1Q967_9LAMI
MEFQLPFSLNTSLLILFFLFLLVKEYTRSKTRNATQKLPPGPKKLPFIGNLHQMLGSLPHRSLSNLAKKYGPIMHLQIGELSTIVISSPRIAEEVFKTNDINFSDRPDLVVSKIIFYNSGAIAAAPYGEYWRDVRKICTMELLSTKKVQSFHSLMEEEVSHLISSIRSSEGVAINLTEKSTDLESSIVCRSTVGRKCKDQKSIINLGKEATSFAGIFNVGDIFPSLALLDSIFGSKRKLFKMHKMIDNILEGIIREHEEDLFSSTMDKTSDDQQSEEDVLDILLRLKDKNDEAITRDNIKANIFILLAAGIDTSSTLIEWTMSELMKNPRVMEKVQAEVRQAFKGKEKILQSDIQDLSYLKMVIKETLRIHPPGPLLGPRRCKEQCKIGGYDIPANTTTIINGWAIGRDPEYWKNPEAFDPERFNNISTTYTGAHFEFIPFGAGRRICPGINFSLAGVELSLANLLYHFNWKLPGGISPDQLDMTEKFGAAAGRKNNLYLIPMSYVPKNE